MNSFYSPNLNPTWISRNSHVDQEGGRREGLVVTSESASSDSSVVLSLSLTRIHTHTPPLYPSLCFSQCLAASACHMRKISQETVAKEALSLTTPQSWVIGCYSFTSKSSVLTDRLWVLLFCCLQWPVMRNRTCNKINIMLHTLFVYHICVTL